jgi:methylenetetrahydrofolate dehydrogenase (NADP+)/methenyltetrahydrofolate cyclohydrolase
MHLLDGKRLADQIQAELKQQQTYSAFTPTLAVMIVGDDPASHLYVRMKHRVGEELGLDIRIHPFSASTPTRALVDQIRAWNQDPSIHGILVQVPLPAGHDESTIINQMSPEKDVDGFHPENIALLESGNPTLLSPVHEGILRLINQAPISLNGVQTTIIGNSEIFTKPLAHLLQTAGSIVRVMSADSLDRDWLKTSEIVIIAIGRARFLKPEDVRDDAVLIDVGTTRDGDKKIWGDIDIERFTDTDCWITPVPGGVGPMTIALLMRNVIKCADRQEKS